MTLDDISDGQAVWISGVGSPVIRIGTRERPTHGTRDKLTPYYVVVVDNNWTEYLCDGSLHCCKVTL